MSENRFIYILLFLLFGTTFLNCDDHEQVTLSSADYKIVDSIYGASSTILRKEMDSICLVERSKWLKEFKDSIKQQRLYEISKLLEQEN